MDKSDCVGRRPKYFDILDSFERLVCTRTLVEKLCDDICGVKNNQSVECEKKPEPKPSLLEVLDRTPADMQAQCNMIESALEEIRAQIL